MYPILNIKGQNISKDEFILNFLHICKSHQNSQRALAFAFIIYDYTSPHITKILNDNDYWNSLNKIAGNFLTVFHADCRFPTLNSKVIRFRNGVAYNSMFGIQTENDDPSIISFAILENYFGISEPVKIPSILFFQVDNMEITDYMFLNLKENEIEKTYNEIYEILNEVTATLKGISPDCYHNNGPVFREIRNSVLHIKHRTIVSKLLTHIKISDFFPLLFN